MADGKQEAAWVHDGAMMLAMRKVFTGEGPNLIDLIPERYREGADEEKTEADEEAESALAFAELEAGLKALSRQMEPPIAGFAR